jgi:hypothetical protein
VLQPFPLGTAHQIDLIPTLPMKHTLLLLAGSLLLVGAAHAQATFSVGPRLGGNVSTVRYASGEDKISSRLGFEAGVMGSLQFGHVAVQPAVLFAQRGYTRTPDFYDSGFGGLTRASVRLNYLTIPLQVAYVQRTNGQGFQLSAGPYVSFLVGGNSLSDYQFISWGAQQRRQTVAAADVHTVDISPSSVQEPAHTVYSRRLDLGGQVGLGYRLGGALLQVSYSLGLRNVATTERYTINNMSPTYDVGNPAYRNRSFQVALSYLFGARS